MKVSLDGGVTYRDAPEGVRVIYEDVDVPGEDDPKGQLHVNLSDESIIMDVWCSRQSDLDTNLGTMCDSIDDLILDMVETNS